MNDMTYVLCKEWEYEPKMSFDNDTLRYVTIRPADVSYNVLKSFYLGKSRKSRIITFGPSVISWSQLFKQIYYNGISNERYSNTVSTFEEFMVNANVNALVFPMVENWYVNYNYSNYCVKTIDIKTKEVWFNCIEKTLKMLSEH